jgi:Ca2+-transporting ATPase
MLLTSLALGAAVLVSVAAVYAWARYAGRSDGEARGIAFIAIVFGNLAMILAYRSREQRIAHALRQSTPALWIILAAAIAALCISLYVPSVSALFRFAAPSVADLAVAALAGVVAVLAYDQWRFATRSKASTLRS